MELFPVHYSFIKIANFNRTISRNALPVRYPEGKGKGNLLLIKLHIFLTIRGSVAFTPSKDGLL